MAARDTDWAHIHVRGAPRDEGAPYVSRARVVLGYVKQEAARNGLQTYAHQEKLADGTVIRAELNGGIPRMVIFPVTGGSSGREIEVKDAFVTTPRNDAHPNGADPDYPQVVLERLSGAWRSRFYDSSTPEFDAIAGPKGTYKTLGGQLAFPDGLKHGGNVDWRSMDGVRVSWYGPSSRYWYDGWRQPSAQYGKYVFMLGQVLLDVDDYCTESNVNQLNRLVMGAAVDLERMRLYVVQAAMADQPNVAPSAPASEGLDVTPPSPTGPIPITVYAYTLRKEDKPDAMAFAVVAESAEILYDGALNCACNPWFFSQDLDRAVSYAVPQHVEFSAEAEEDAWRSGFSIRTLPQASSMRFDLSITEQPNGTETASVAQTAVSLSGIGRAPIATDFDRGREHTVYIERGAYALADYPAIFMDVGGVRTPLFFHGPSGNPDRPDFFYFSYVFWADAREGSAVFHVEREVMSAYAGEGNPWPANGLLKVTNEFFVAGGKVLSMREIAFIQRGSRWTQRAAYFFGAMNSRPVSPMAFLYYAMNGDFGQTYVTVGMFGVASHNNANAYTPVDQLFGGAGINTGFDSASPLFSEFFGRDEDLPPLRADAYGKKWLLGAAAYDQDAIYSFTTMVDTGVGGESIRTPLIAHFISDDTLDARTGIGGDSAAYEPIWLLGALPRAATTQGGASP